MKAITVKQPGGKDQLQITEQPTSKPGHEEILVRVKATAVNRTDILNRENDGGYADTPVLGVEASGIVEKAGNNANIEAGTRVTGLVNGGGYAEYAIMPAGRAMVIPDNLSFEAAAAIPEVFLTAYQTLFWLGELGKEETVLVHAGGSGVGTAAIQLAKILKQANVITTAGSKEKLDMASSLGADVCINYKEQSFDQIVDETTNGRGADVILDFIGASYWTKNLASAGVDSRWILIGLLGGTTVEQANIGKLMSKRIHFKGTLLTPRSDAYKADLSQTFATEALPLFETGELKPLIDRVFNFADVQDAHAHMENNKNIGKIVLRV